PFRPAHPRSDAVLPPLADDAEGGKRADDPLFERGYIAAQIAAASFEVEHHIDDPLPGPVIGELAAAPGRKDREARYKKLLRPGAGASRIERGMFNEPDQFRCRPGGDRSGPRLHGGKRLGVADGALAHA